MVNAILVCLEYIWIGRFYRPQIPILLASFYIKALFVVLEIGVAIGFGICMKSKTSERKDAAAVLEWGMSQSQFVMRSDADQISRCPHLCILRFLLCYRLAPVYSYSQARTSRGEIFSPKSYHRPRGTDKFLVESLSF